ncbi:putative metal-binding motif-containing protein, partial [Candidatus Pacearchaeota archaeon]|nr:putative metal-binding motif-containing protein [Candidatus Pacearchaeota archaeon]
MNKKFLLLMFAGIFFILFFSGVVSSATKDVKIDWNGVPFNWCDGATGAGHNVEYCGYRVSDKVEVACDESGDYDSPSSCGGDSGCLLANAGDYSVIVYAGFWYNAKCRGQSHGAGKHYSNPTAYWDNGEKYDADYSPHHSPIQSATATCIDSDGDNYYSSVIVGSGTNGGVVALCGAEESASCDNDASNFPGNVEAPDGKDNDCDGVIDEGFSCVDGQTPQSCGTTNVGECEYGTQTCSGGQWGTCGGTYVGPSPEVYESPGLDNDCDGLVNEGVGPCTDADGDKWVAQASGQCSPLTAPAISGFKGYSDCNDVSPSGLKVYPNAPEQCDGVDNQCPQSQTSVDENPNTICSTPG